MSDASFSRLIAVDRIPSRGKHFRLEADEEERRAVAATLGIVEVRSLAAELDVSPLGADAFSVRGKVAASVVQTDVVTLEPLAQKVEEDIDVTLVPSAEPLGGRKEDVSEVAGRDVYRGGQIDLGAIAVEHLALGLDPYPRGPGVEFAAHIEDDPAAGGSPFSVLARLKRGQK
jgi:hypothetical protein